MADLKAARDHIISRLRDLGMVTPFTGQVEIVTALLDEFAAIVSAAVSVQIASGLRLGARENTPSPVANQPVAVGRAYAVNLGLPSAEDLDAVAAEEQAREATRRTESETETSSDETKDADSEMEPAETEPEPVSQTEEVASGD